MGRARERYQPRHAEASVLRGVVREHLEKFLSAAADRTDGAGPAEDNGSHFTTLKMMEGFLTRYSCQS